MSSALPVWDVGVGVGWVRCGWVGVGWGRRSAAAAAAGFGLQFEFVPHPKDNAAKPPPRRGSSFQQVAAALSLTDIQKKWTELAGTETLAPPPAPAPAQ